LYQKAAVLTRGIIADHPFADGNKRTGIMSGLIFLNLNQVDTVKLSDKNMEDFAVKIAVDHCSVEQIAQWSKQNSKKL